MTTRSMQGPTILRLTIVVLLMFPLLAGSPISAPADSAGVIYVDADAPGPTHGGSSWPDAYVYLQDALDWTESLGDWNGDSIDTIGIY